jgi:hypothetical protein
MMSEYAEIYGVMTVFSIIIIMQINSLRDEMNNRLRDMEDDLCRIEAKVDGMERHREAR